MREKLALDLKEAMKSKDKEKLSVLRMVKGAMQLEEINLKRELNDNEIVNIIAKQIKTRKESIVEFEKGNRTDLIDQANLEINILNEYMPEQMSEEEIAKEVDRVFNELNPNPNEMGKIMGALSHLKGKADMGIVNRLVKEKLGK